MEFTLTSDAFTDGESIPARFTCDGDDVSPALKWQGVPDEAQSLALIMDDPDAGHRYLEERVPLQRLGRPEEVAGLIAFLAGNEASYVTGAAVPVDGGWRLSGRPVVQ